MRALERIKRLQLVFSVVALAWGLTFLLFGVHGWRSSATTGLRASWFPGTVAAIGAILTGLSIISIGSVLSEYNGAAQLVRFRCRDGGGLAVSGETVEVMRASTDADHRRHHASRLRRARSRAVFYPRHSAPSAVSSASLPPFARHFPSPSL